MIRARRADRWRCRPGRMPFWPRRLPPGRPIASVASVSVTFHGPPRRRTPPADPGSPLPRRRRRGYGSAVVATIALSGCLQLHEVAGRAHRRWVGRRQCGRPRHGQIASPESIGFDVNRVVNAALPAELTTYIRGRGGNAARRRGGPYDRCERLDQRQPDVPDREHRQVRHPRHAALPAPKLEDLDVVEPRRASRSR